MVLRVVFGANFVGGRLPALIWGVRDKKKIAEYFASEIGRSQSVGALCKFATGPILQ